MSVLIGKRPVGPGHPTYIVAELGINHNGDVELASRTITAAKSAGADAVKFQTYRTEDFIDDRAMTYRYKSQGREVEETLYDMFKRAELSREDLTRLTAQCAEIGIDWHATPTGTEGVRELVELGVQVLKNGSDFIGHLPLIRSMGETGLPVVLSTGMATLGDIDDGVKTVRSAGNQQIILLHCTSQYPTPASEAHLRRISSLASAFDCLTGYSDHTEGATASIAAVALGACWIEKHFTIDRNLPGPDQHLSADPGELNQIVSGIRFLEEALGDAQIELSDKEIDARRQHRLSCVARSDLNASAVLEEDQISFMRPGDGLCPSERHLLVGRQLVHPVRRGHVFRLDDFK